MPKKRSKPAKKAPKTVAAAPMGALEEAIAIRTSVKARLDGCAPEDMPKLVDSYSRASNVCRQLEKDRKRAMSEFTDDEVSEYVRGLPDRRREAILIAAQGASLAGKPLF